jgi:D-serine deaminase-like pyridoxal phosphate-dependent protein
VYTTPNDLPTPALLVDLDLFEANLVKMQAAATTAGKRLRPHAKAHKCLTIAERQCEAGAVGVAVATIAEMRLMTSGGIGVLLTTPVADRVKTDAIAMMRVDGADIQVVVDHPGQVRLYGDSAKKAGVMIKVLVDLDVGDHRTGIPCDERAIELAQEIERNRNLVFGGLQAYSVSGSHTEGFETRKARSRAALGQAVQVRRRLLDVGLDATTLTGGSTGTWNIDLEIPEFSELQAGSYPLMDVAYRRIIGDDFRVALHVLTTVISASHTDRVTVDGGFKAFATDRPFGPEPDGLTGVRWEWAGDEHGFLHIDSPPGPIALGDKIRFVAPHTDPTMNLHDRVYAIRDDRIEAMWPLKRA